MSKFSTTLPVNVDAIVESLPKNSFLHGVRIGDDRKSLVVDWECDDLLTPYTVAVEVSPEALAGKSPLPACVKKRVPAPAPAPDTDAECKKVQNEEVAPPAPRKAKQKQ